jgi:Cu(I)/Ag(I) efflux system membrane fusion protein
MSKLKLILPAMILVSCSAPQGQSVRIGDMKAVIAVDPDPPIVGDNRIHLLLVDATGNPLEGAHIELVYAMPAMGSMPEMKGRAQVEPQGRGRYLMTYPLSMHGDWTLTLTITAGGASPEIVMLRASPPHKGVSIVRASASAPEGHRADRLLDISVERQQRIGLTFATVEERSLRAEVRAVGRIVVDERKLSDVALRFEAYIEKLLVAETGRAVRAGDPLLVLYSPDLLDAEQQLQQAHRAERAKVPGSTDLVRAASERLRFWGLGVKEIESIAARDQPEGTITVRSPATGVVLEKNAVAGTHAMSGTTLYRIGNLGQVWVATDIYEHEAPMIAVGLSATVSLPAVPGAEIEGRVSFVAPTVNEKTRTLTARIELQNASLQLKPGMFADVRIARPLGLRLSVPDSALILSGEHRYAFVERTPGRLEPVEVEIGLGANGFDEVRSGLVKGDRVVDRATFLVASEALLKDALPRWSSK